MFKGTRIPVRLVAAMLDQEADEGEVLDGYPSLQCTHLELSRIWAAAHPCTTRRKTLHELGFVLKSSLRVPLGTKPGTH